MQSGPFFERERREFLCLVLIVAALHCAIPAHATITSLGNVNPAPAMSTDSTHLLIGNTATGTMIVNGGSDVVALSSTLGQAPGALGVAQITGSGSTWTMGLGLVVGNGGDGIAQVSAGGQIQSASGSLGAQSGSNGTVSVGGDNSRWMIASNLIVGNAGNGSLTIADGGWVDLGGNLTLGGSATGDGAVNLAGGTLRLHGGTLAVGTGVADFGFGNGRLEGVGMVALATPFVQLEGTLAPGNGIGTTTIAGDYVLDGGQLEIGINGLGVPGTNWDRLRVNGTVDLWGDNGLADGVLRVVLGFAPAVGSEFLFLVNDAAESVIGKFASINVASTSFGGQRYVFEILYAAGDGNDVALRTDSIHGLGDFNGDGTVDAADYTVWRDGLGTLYTLADYDEWKSHFGQSVGAGAFVDSHHAAPEPDTLCLVAVVHIVLGFAVGRRRRATFCLKRATDDVESSHAHEH